MEEKLSVPGNQKAQLAPVSETQYFSHIIKWPGENLTRISVWYTGTINNWQRIQEVNLSIDPRRIDIGDTILIPENLLITSEPMPMDFRGVVQEKKKPAPESLPGVSSSSGQSQLFEPVDTQTVQEKKKPAPESLPGASSSSGQSQLFEPVDAQTVQEKKKPAPESLPGVSSSSGQNQLFEPVDTQTVQQKKEPAPESLPELSLSSGDTQLFGPIDIQTEELNDNSPDGLSLPLETIE